jgi:hypothetical protein
MAGFRTATRTWSFRKSLSWLVESCDCRMPYAFWIGVRVTNLQENTVSGQEPVE